MLRLRRALGASTATFPAAVARVLPCSPSSPQPCLNTPLLVVGPALPAVTLTLLSRFSRFSREEEEQFRDIEKWAQSFKLADIPVSSFERSFVRSSGPGGQHVNKTNSKAELRFALNSAGWLPAAVKDRLRANPGFRRYLTQNGSGNSGSNGVEVVLTADDHRVQSQNLNECVSKLYAAIQEACVVPKETSAEQKEKVSRLKAASDARNKAEKQRQKERKESRKPQREW